ncbi:hypothetical protein BC826DRAFT_84148 [Russula brevipes]|nr:hypothetical protein BC826DRAFT_84148 [Russula brevipes]
MEWLGPTVRILITVSASLGEALGTPFPPAKAVFIGIGALLSAAAGVIASYDVLVNIFERIRFFLLRLKIYTDISLASELTEILGRIMAEVILILALTTKEMTQGQMKKFMKRLVGKTEIENALQRLDGLTRKKHGCCG